MGDFQVLHFSIELNLQLIRSEVESRRFPKEVKEELNNILMSSQVENSLGTQKLLIQLWFESAGSNQRAEPIT